ncbi:hypothetical protein [Mobilicoccus massiliensis]|uniref:hypothetical protein n=1 Tax=Mobilicoccus massiliensis TaxID=1522310 RepID=UPI000693411B|nr:hypothetical protein [Mobilicoccus massiliensis]
MAITTAQALARAAVTGTGELLLHAFTPPRVGTTPARQSGAANRLRRRLALIRPDAVVAYDLVDESERTAAERPCPFSPVVDPAEFARIHLTGCTTPRVLYRGIGSRTEQEFTRWLAGLPAGTAVVPVGAVAPDARMITSLPRAHEIVRIARPDILLGGITVPERHTLGRDEDRRLLLKQRSGCSFFISQLVYDPLPAAAVAEAYAVRVRADGLRPAPLIFALAPCGSPRQLDLLHWLGVAVPPQVARRLRTSRDPRRDSSEHCLAVARELAVVCRGLGLPFGFSVEGLSQSPADTDAAVRLAAELGSVLRR